MDRILNNLFSSFLSPFLFKNQGIVLCLHSVKKYGSSKLGRMAITDRFLEDMILHFKRQNVPIIPLEDALESAHLPTVKPFICITFDDGYRDNYTDAYPVFLKHNVPFTVFLTTGLVDRTIPMWWDAVEKIIDVQNQLYFETRLLRNTTSSEKTKNYSMVSNIMRSCQQPEMLEYLEDFITKNNTDFTLESTYDQALTWDMIREMQAGGLACFGAHSVSHRLFSSLNKSELYTEITASKQRIKEMTGMTPVYFAYPFGQLNEIGEDASSVVAASGFKAGLSTTRNTVNKHTINNLYTLPRVMLGRGSQNILKLQLQLSRLKAF